MNPSQEGGQRSSPELPSERVRGSPMSDIRVVLVDDHAVLREGLKALLNTQPGLMVVGEAADGQAAYELILRIRPDVVVLDLSMPHLSGGQTTERLHHVCPEVKVIALTVHEDRIWLHRLLTAGAAGYVLKRSAADELIRAIRTVARGGVYLDPALTGKLIGGFVHHPDRPGEAIELSDREVTVARLIAQGYSIKEIAAQLAVSSKTVETYKSRAMDKLSVHSRADLVRYAIDCHWFDGL